MNFLSVLLATMCGVCAAVALLGFAMSRYERRER